MGALGGVTRSWGRRVMSERLQQAEAQRLLGEINHMLATEPLTGQQRRDLELHAAKLAGALLRPWFPVTGKGRLIMAGILGLGLQQAWIGNFQPIIWWSILPLFSPRIMGECALMFGKVARLFSRS
jgi:hypothetical protein